MASKPSEIDRVALLDRLGLTFKEKRELKKLFTEKAKNDVHILVAGRTGAGKSKLVNALCGAIVAEEGKYLKPETAQITRYLAMSNNGYTINVWDSPGLLDGNKKGSQYLQAMTDTCRGEIDMLLYCVDMSYPRAVVQEIAKGMELVTKALSHDVWRHAMVVLTQANIVESRLAEDKHLEGDMLKFRFQELVVLWKEKVGYALETAGIPPEVISNVAIEPAGDYITPHLPDRIHWLGYLWLKFFHHARDEAKLAILENNDHRLRNAEYLRPEGDSSEGGDLGKSKSPAIVVAKEWLLSLPDHLSMLIKKILAKQHLKHIKPTVSS